MARATLIGFIVTFWVALFSLFWATNSISHEGGTNSHEGGFSKRSEQHLAEIHIDLYEVVFLARLLSEVPFEITDGKRTIEEQRHYYKILEAYLNEVYMGQDKARGVHGMGLASQF